MAEDLAPVVQQAVGIDDAWPTSWVSAPLSTTQVNPVTVGLFRLEGTRRSLVGHQSRGPWC